MYRPALHFARTPAELADPQLSWNRDDTAFFAAGACHILAWAITRQHPTGELAIIYLRPRPGYPGHHVYATNGTWAFDHCGWTKEEELLTTTTQDCQRTHPGWQADQLEIHDDLETFCRQNHHRAPSQYPHNPWPRAHNYIRRFPLPSR